MTSPLPERWWQLLGLEELAEGAWTVPSRAFWRHEDFSKLPSQQTLLAGSMGQS